VFFISDFCICMGSYITSINHTKSPLNFSKGLSEADINEAFKQVEEAKKEKAESSKVSASTAPLTGASPDDTNEVKESTIFEKRSN
jgi:hypothetical protein